MEGLIMFKLIAKLAGTDVTKDLNLKTTIDGMMISTVKLPIEHWHEWIADDTVADAMLDRIMQNHQRLTLAGVSLRKSKPQPRQGDIEVGKRLAPKIR